MERRLLSELNRDLEGYGLSLSSQGNGWLILRNTDGNIMFSVKTDDVFDADGMRFEDDLA
jgi:hypothetical protein